MTLWSIFRTLSASLLSRLLFYTCCENQLTVVSRNRWESRGRENADRVIWNEQIFVCICRTGCIFDEYFDSQTKPSMFQCSCGRQNKRIKFKSSQVHHLLSYVCMCSVMSNSLWPHGLQPARLLCPWHSPGKNTGVGCHFLLQVIFMTQGSNPCLLSLLHWQIDCLPLHHFYSLIWIFFEFEFCSENYSWNEVEENANVL